MARRRCEGRLGVFRALAPPPACVLGGAGAAMNWETRLLVHGEVAEAGMDPAEHYLAFGHQEGRTGVPPRLGYVTERDAAGRSDFFVKAFSAIAANGIDGPYLEFGVGRGQTMWLAWRASRSYRLDLHLWGFDSFVGLPPSGSAIDTSHPNWLPGEYANTEDSVRRNISALGVELEDVTFVPGFYNESLAPERRAGLPDRASFVYIDCDMYESTVDALDYVGDIARHGMLVGFDDWFLWSSTRSAGEKVAFDEFQARRPDLHFHPFHPIGWHGTSFYVTTD
jgi:O-methyltransferase